MNKTKMENDMIRINSIKKEFVTLACVIIPLFLIASHCNGSGIAKQWTRIWGSAVSDYGYGVAVDTNGNSYVAGTTEGAYDGQTNAGYSDICLAKYNSSGSNLWTRIWGSATYDRGWGVAVDQAGNCYVAGTTEGGFDGQTNAGGYDICLTKYNAGGTNQWTRIWGSANGDGGYGVAVDQAGNSYVAGHTRGGFDGQTNAGHFDICLTKYNSSGSNLWTRIWGSAVSDHGWGVAVDQAGNSYVAGYTEGEFDGQTNAGSTDICLTKYNAAGTKQWTRIWGSAVSDYGVGAAVDQAGNSYVAGYTAGGFDGQTNAGDRDICLTTFVEPIPFVDITNADFVVELPATTATIGGTNNEFIAVNSSMWWENTSTSGVAGAFVADISREWTISGISLANGMNNISVSGSNEFGDIASDTVKITLVPEPGLGVLIIGLVALSRNRLVSRGLIRAA